VRREFIVLLLSTVCVAAPRAIAPDVLRSTSAIPPELAGRLREPAGFQRAASGQYFLFDRRGHTVYGVDSTQTSIWQIVQIGAEEGRILDPAAFSVASDGTFVVADAPNRRERVQIFSPVGFRIGGFMLRGRTVPSVRLNGSYLGGIGSLQYTGRSILMSQPDTGALVSEYTLAGAVNRLIGTLRRTGHEDDPDLHVALNTGTAIPLPDGGFYFVFQTGEPMFRRYDKSGRMLFERRIQGREVDEVVDRLPTTWPRRKVDDDELPFVSPTIRAAAADSAGRLWVSLVTPYTLVFDADGDKIRTVQLRGAGLVSPDSLFFDARGALLVTPGLLQFAP
jgi:hypothetical protein